MKWVGSSYKLSTIVFICFPNRVAFKKKYIICFYFNLVKFPELALNK